MGDGAFAAASLMMLQQPGAAGNGVLGPGSPSTVAAGQPDGLSSNGCNNGGTTTAGPAGSGSSMHLQNGALQILQQQQQQQLDGATPQFWQAPHSQTSQQQQQRWSSAQPADLKQQLQVQQLLLQQQQQLQLQLQQDNMQQQIPAQVQLGAQMAQLHAQHNYNSNRQPLAPSGQQGAVQWPKMEQAAPQQQQQQQGNGQLQGQQQQQQRAFLPPQSQQPAQPQQQQRQQVAAVSALRQSLCAMQQQQQGEAQPSPHGPSQPQQQQQPNTRSGWQPVVAAVAQQPGSQQQHQATSGSTGSVTADGPPSSNLTVRLTVQLVGTYRKCTAAEGAARGVPQPLARKILTRPAAGVNNNGWDNEGCDLILATQVGGGWVEGMH